MLPPLNLMMQQMEVYKTGRKFQIPGIKLDMNFEIL